MLDSLSDSEPEMVNENYALVKQLGQGAQGDVYLMLDMRDNVQYAAKLVRIQISLMVQFKKQLRFDLE